jgi:uncharacterized protein YjbI with pentapeptide repeats
MLLWLIALISLVIGPQLLLLFFLLQFLPHHSESIAWMQRIVVLLDLGLLWALWPTLGRADEFVAPWSWRYLRWVVVPLRRARWWVHFRLQWVFGRPVRLPRLGVGRFASVLANAFVLVLVFLVASFPGEHLDGWIRPNIAWMPGLRALRKALVEGKVDQASNRPESWFSNVLVLPSFDLTEDPRFDTPAKIQAAHRTLRLRNRDLRGAVLAGADLRAAELDFADLQNAMLAGARLQGASLKFAQLQDAEFASASLQGAAMQFADLRGAELNSTDLEGAWLSNADLRGAALQSTNLNGAALDHAYLEGALFQWVQLQGASLIGTEFDLAVVYQPYVWRTDLREASSVGMWLTTPITDRVWGGAEIDQPWDQSDYDKLKALLERDIPLGAVQRDQTLKQIARLDPGASQPHESEMAQYWREIAQGPREGGHDNRVSRLVQMACDPENAPYVLGNIIRYTYLLPPGCPARLRPGCLSH